MKNFFNDSEDSQEDKLTKEDKIQIIIKIVPILLIIVILLITFVVNKNKNQKPDETPQDVVSTEIIVPSSSPSAVQETEADPSPDVAASKATASLKPTPEAAATATPDLEEETLDFSKVKFDTQAQLKEMMSYWEQGNQKALDDLAYLDRFRAMSYQLKGTNKFYYAGETNADGKPNGTGIAVYADNQYYYGAWKNGVREGEGRFMHYHIHSSANSRDVYLFHQYSGSFKNDLPDGSGSEHYDFVTERLQKDTRYYSNFIGTYKQGLLDGSFYITTIDRKNNFEEWNATAKMGSFVYLSREKDKQGCRPALVDTEDEQNFIWLSDKENQNWGVKCYIRGEN